MRFHIAFASTFFFFALGTSGPAVSTDNPPSDPQPVSVQFNLDQRFDDVRLIPGTKEALLVSAEQGRVVRYNLDEGRNMRAFNLPSVVDLIIDDAGRFAYLVALDTEVPASVLRLDLAEGTVSASPLPGKLTDPKLALGANGQLILADRGAGAVFVGPVAAFDAVPPAPVGFPAAGIPNDVPVAELAGLTEEDMVFLSAANAPAIYGLETNTKRRHRLTALQQSGGTEN